MEQIEQSILRGLLYNDEYARKVYPHLRQEFFEGPLGTCFDVYCDLFEKYHKVPTLESVLVTMQNRSMDEGAYEGALEALEGAYRDRDEPLDPDWLRDETERYCVDKAAYNAIIDSMSIIEGKDKNRDRNSIPGILEDAVSINFDTNIGTDFFSDTLRRYEYYTSDEEKIPFPLKALNRLSNGGLPNKTLSCILAGTNVGKSALMCYLAGEWLKAGYNVLYISMEMAEEAIGQRIEANLLDTSTDDLGKIKTYDEYKGRVDKLRDKTHGELFIKEYPTSGAHVGHFRNLLKELKQKKKFKPDIVFIDYINICASSRYKTLNGVNSYSYIKSIAEEIRGLAVEEKIRVMTATQTNREGFSTQAPDVTNTSESFGLPQTVDWMIAAITNEQLMEERKQIFHLLKTRFGNKASVKGQLIRVDFDKMRYHDIDSDTYDETRDAIDPPTPKSGPSASGNNFTDWNL